MYAFGKLSLMQTRLYLREPMAIFFTLLLGPLLLVMMGFIFGNAPISQLNGLSQMDISVPCYIALTIGITALTSVPTLAVSRREAGVLRRFSVTPLRPLVYFLTDILAPIMITLASCVILIMMGLWFYHVRFEGQWLNLAGGVCLSTLSFFALGYALAGIFPNMRTAIVVGNAVIVPMNILSGALIPIEILPAGVRSFANYLPLTHAVTLLRGLWFGEAWSVHLLNVAVLAGIFLVGVVVIVLTFKWE
jgi:ABC-2 type transport system permease protein